MSASAGAQPRLVARLQVVGAGPVVFGLPVPEPAPGTRFLLRSTHGERPLQLRALTPPQRGRQWLQFRAECEPGSWELCWERRAPPAVPPAGPPAAARALPLLGLGEPDWMPVDPSAPEVREQGTVAVCTEARGAFGDVTVEVAAAHWARGAVDLELRFSTRVRSLVTLQDLRLRVAGVTPEDEVAPGLVRSKNGALRWVLAAARGQAGFQRGAATPVADPTADPAADHVVATVLPRGTLLEAGECLAVQFRFAPRGQPVPGDRPPLVRAPPAFWRAAGVLPPGEGARGEGCRKALETAALAVLDERVTGRDFGGFRRAQGVWTNLEFDVALALLRLELAGGAAELRWGASDAARHWACRLLAGEGDRATAGLPFVHGQRARGGETEAGHVWVAGALLTGLVTGDDLMVAAARRAADALSGMVLADRDETQAGRRDRRRNLGWPLLELEQLLRLEPRPVWLLAADRCASELVGRYDRSLHAFRFGESESERSAAYEEKLWLTGGIVLPALRAHLRRRPDQRLLRETLHLAEAAHLSRALRGDGRVRSHAWLDGPGGALLGDGVPCDHARALFVLEGFPPEAVLSGALTTALRRALAQPVDPKALDPITQITMAGRLDLVFR